TNARATDDFPWAGRPVTMRAVMFMKGEPAP
ncbi:MAG: hypothetical protein ACI9BH_002968, partial [Paracoccaceae bacterium]